MNVAIISDTHVPDREDAIPEEFRERIDETDHVVHAGDVTDADVLADVRELAADLTAVHGNMDTDLDLPTVATVELAGVTFVVFHNYLGVRTADDWFQGLADATTTHADPPFVGVGGHSHQVEDEAFELFEEIEEVDGETVRLLNPGTATGADPAERATMMTAEIDDGELVEVTLHEHEG